MGENDEMRGTGISNKSANKLPYFHIYARHFWFDCIPPQSIIERKRVCSEWIESHKSTGI